MKKMVKVVDYRVTEEWLMAGYFNDYNTLEEAEKAFEEACETCGDFAILEEVTTIYEVGFFGRKAVKEVIKNRIDEFYR